MAELKTLLGDIRVSEVIFFFIATMYAIKFIFSGYQKVTYIIALNVLFTVSILYVFKNKIGEEPSTLIGAFFGFTTVELWSLAGIKKKKIEKETDYE